MGTVAAVTSDASDWEPLSLLLVLGVFAIASEILAVKVHETTGIEANRATWWFTSCAPYVLAVVFLGPAPACAMAVIALLIFAVRKRTPWRHVAANLANYGVHLVTQGLLAAAAIEHWGIATTDLAFPLLVMIIYAYGTVASFLYNSAYGAIAYGESMREVFWREWRLQIAAETPIAMATGLTAYVYASSGSGALLLLVGLQLVFMLLQHELGRSYEREMTVSLYAKRIEALSASRGRLVGQVLTAEEGERRRLAQGLHDDAMQNLLTARQDLEELNGGYAVRRVQATLDATIDQLRDAIFELHPAVLEQVGLVPAIEALVDRYCRRAGFQSSLHLRAPASRDHDALLFTICRELVGNAAAHSGATEIQVELAEHVGFVSLTVTDNGRGMEANALRVARENGHVGLASTAERVEALGGRFEIRNRPGMGIGISITVPTEVPLPATDRESESESETLPSLVPTVEPVS